MSSANTISIRLEVQGTPDVLNKLRSVLTGVNGLDAGLKQAKASMGSGFNLGPLQGLQNAIGQTETKVNTLKAKMTTLGSEVAKNGAAFGVATASVWGIYNAYDSLVKVEIRAQQAQTRVMTTTTSLASMEERLRQARETGNLTANEMAILEEKIINTKARLAVAQARSADLQGDVNEAWGAFASQVGPQVIAAAGSLSQLFTNMRTSLTGVVPRLREFIGGLITTRAQAGVTAGSAFTLSGALATAGPAGQIGATGVRAFSGALKGLLIGTGIGAAVVAIGILIESLGLFNTATATTSDETINNFADAAQGPKAFSTSTQTSMEKATAIVEKYGKDTKIILAEASAAYVESVMEEIKADQLRNQAAANKSKVLLDATQKEIDIYDKKFAAQDRNNLLTKEEEERWKSLIPIRNAAANSYETSTKLVNLEGTELSKLSPILTELTNKEKVATEQHRLVTTGTQEMQKAWVTTFASMDQVVDDWLAKNKGLIIGLGSQERAMTALAKPWIDDTFGKELNAEATKRVGDAIKVLLPDQEKEAKALEKETEKIDQLAIKAEELKNKFGVEVPEAFLTNEKALESYGRTLDKNKEILDEWLKKTEFLKDISGLEKAFKIEFETDKEVKDFIKDLPKSTKKKIKLIIDNLSDWAGVKNIFEIIAPGIFQATDSGLVNESGQTIFRVGIRPELNNPKDIENIAETMIEAIEDQFGKNTKNPVVANIIKDLESADTEAELMAAFKKWGIFLDQIILENAEQTGKDYGTKLGTGAQTTFKTAMENFDPFNILGGKKPEGITTFDEHGNPINTPVGGDTATQVTDQTNLQTAIKNTQTAFKNLETEGGKSLAALAKVSSTQINGMVKNLNVGYVSAGHLQVGLANLSNQGFKSLAQLANASSKAIQGMRNNLNVGYVSAGHLQTGLANLANQGSKSLMALASASSKAMNGLVNNVNKGTNAIEGLKDAIAGLKNKTVHIGLTGPGVKFLATGFHGIVDKPTIMVVGEAGAERVDVSPVVGGQGKTSLESERNVRIEPVGRIETGSRLQREIIKEGRGGPQTIQITTYNSLYPNSDVMRKTVQQFSLDGTGSFSQA